MSLSPIVPTSREEKGAERARRNPLKRRVTSAPFPVHYPARMGEVDASQRHAELFYLQKQIQSQTPMVIVLEDGEKIEGRIEWYDRNSIKVRGRTKSLIYKPAIKYMYKVAENGQ